MHLLLSGSRGFIGSGAGGFLQAAGHRVTRLVRGASPAGADALAWRADGTLDLAGQAFDAVVHLAGEPIMGRWTAAKRRRIYDSRVAGTRRLCEALAASPARPGVMLCASAIGYYGPAGDRELTEGSPAGEGFLPDLVRDWEAACEPARAAGVRVVNLRLGIVLDPRGGALGAMLPLFRLGLGGRLGDGTQWMSWIAMGDVLGAIDHCLHHDELSGPVNLVAPEPVTNAQFTRALAGALRRPAMLPAPRWALRLMLGQVADAAFHSQRVLPARLLAGGYPFRHRALSPALREMLAR